MNSISPNLNIMIKACEKASKSLIRDFGEIENLQVSMKGPSDFVTNADKKVEKILIDELLKAKKIIVLLVKNLVLQKILMKKIYGLLIQLMEQQTFFMAFLISLFV